MMMITTMRGITDGGIILMVPSKGVEGGKARKMRRICTSFLLFNSCTVALYGSIKIYFTVRYQSLRKQMCICLYNGFWINSMTSA